VIEAVDGSDAIVAAIGNLPDVVITDMRMPGPVNAVDLCRHFTRLGVKVMVVTGVGPSEEQEAVKSAGCVALAMKPLAPDALRAQVGRFVQRITLDDRVSL
jgi:CheY-like chemotaxis protein